MTNPFKGIKYFFSGIQLIQQPGVRRYVLMPLLINIVLFTLGLWFAVSQFDSFIKWSLADLPSWLSWLEWIMWFFFAITFYGLVFFSFSIIANIIASPFNGPLSSAVECALNNQNEYQNTNTFLQEVKEALSSEYIKLKYALFLMLPLVLLSLLSFVFPLISPAVALMWLVYTVWVFSLEYADYPMANHGLTFPQIREQLASKRFLSLGFGAMVMIATYIPIINFLVMPVAVAGATKMYLQEFKN